MKRTVEDNVRIGDLLCILRDMGITQTFYITGKVNTLKPMAAEELIEELDQIVDYPTLYYCVTAVDQFDGKTYITIE